MWLSYLPTFMQSYIYTSSKSYLSSKEAFASWRGKKLLWKIYYLMAWFFKVCFACVCAIVAFECILLELRSLRVEAKLFIIQVQHLKHVIDCWGVYESPKGENPFFSPKDFLLFCRKCSYCCGLVKCVCATFTKPSQSRDAGFKNYFWSQKPVDYL